MTQTPDDGQQAEFRGSLMIPSEAEPRNVSLHLDKERKTVAIRFDGEIGGASEWHGSSVRVADRLKYTEVVFTTVGLPKETVQMTWKFNAGYADRTLAGVIIPKKNDQRVTGEKGFTLIRV